MRIGIDARLWNETGVGRYIRNLVFELSKLDAKNEYVLFLKRDDYLKIKLPINFKKVVADIRWHTLDEQVSLAPIIKRENLDLVHFPYYSLPVLYTGKFVVTIHDLIPLHQKTGKASTLSYPMYKIKLKAFKFVVSQAAKKACKIITPSLASKEDIKNLLKIDESKIDVVYEGVDEKLRNKNTNKSNMILYVGNAYPHKNLLTLIKAFGLSRKKIKNMSLVLVGKEDYFYKKLKSEAKKLKLEKDVIFYGWASDSQLSSLYKKTNAVVIPSFIEGFGLPALEAMANRALVLASDIPALREVGGNAAVYFNPNDEDELSEKIVDVFQHKYKENISKGLERVKEFNWRKTAKETLAIYESCNNI